MSPSNRTIKVGGVWAQGAVDPPATPVQSTTYADSGVTEGEIQAGWPFADIVESAKFNEVMRRITSLIKLAEEWGVLPWNSSTTYATKALVMGSNGEIYYCKVASSAGNDPTTSPTQWGLAFEASGSVSTHAGLASPHSGQTPKTSSGSTTNTVDASGHTHAISAASETVKGAVELATAAETTAGTDNTRAVHPAGLKVELDKKAPLASPVLTGVVTAGAQIKGGFGATSTAGVADWNDASNTTSGQGGTLLLGTATNGPGGAGYYHPFTFEYASKDGSGNLTQFAIPYSSSIGDAIFWRLRYNNVWTSWMQLASTGTAQTLSNKTLASPTLTGTPITPTATADTSTTQVASTAFVTGQAGANAPKMDGAVAVGVSKRYSREDHVHPTDTSRAPVASPIFTGEPAAPTAALDTSTTQIATTAFVTNQAGTAAPAMDGTATVGTSKRYSRQDHRHPTDTTRAPVASPTFTGTPAAPTAANGTNTTQLATTAFAVGEVSKAANGYQKLPSGLILQWGTSATINANINRTVTFPLAFPTACTSVVCTPTVSNLNDVDNVKIISVTTTNFVAQNASDHTNTSIRWMAVGY